MTTQFLILRIQSILEGKADVDASQMRAIASEYKRLCEDVERRLVHCASLIRAGRDHVALQVAETEPQLLESINELLFPELDEWRKYCTANSLPMPPFFNETQIALVKSLYTREISENHPLYRDYRRAMRTHKYEEALAIIRTISKVNVTNAAAKDECERLRKRLVVDKFYQAKDAWLEGRQNDALAIAQTIRDDADLMVHDSVWRMISAQIEKFERDGAVERQSAIVAELKSLEASADYPKLLALGAEFDVIGQKYSINADSAARTYVKAQMARASAIQDKDLEKERKTAASRALAAEVSSTIKRDPSPYLKELESLKKQAADMLDKETEAKLKRLTATLKTRIFLARAAKSAAAVSIMALIGAAGYYGYNDYKRQQARDEANALLSSLRNSPTLKDAQQRYAEFSSKYSDLMENPSYKNDIENISLTIKDLEIRKRRIDETLAKLEAFDAASDSDDEWNAAFDSIAKMLSDSEKFFTREQEALVEKINEASSALTGARDKKRANITASLDKLLSDAGNVVNNPDFFSPSFKINSEKAEALLLQARKLVENPGALFAASDIDIEKLETLSARLLSNFRDKASIDLLSADMAETKNIEVFFECLEELGELRSVTQEMRSQIGKLLDERETILFNVYGGMVDYKLAAETPDSFTTCEIDFTGDEIAGRIHKHTSGQKTVYTDGKLAVRKQVWKGGSETVQEAMEITPNGSTRASIYRLNESDGMRSRGSILTEGGLSVESQLARRAEQLAKEVSPLKAMEMVGNAECNPVFKVWLEKKLLDAMRADPVKSGLAYSESLKAREKRIDDLSVEVTPTSWMYERQPRLNLVKSELYSRRAPDYLAEANERAAMVRAAFMNPLVLSGYVLPDGAFKAEPKTPPLFGIKRSYEFGEIREKEGAIFSPIFRKPNR